MADWTAQLFNFGESRNWAPLPKRRALKAFADHSGLRVSGVAADRALRCGYAALAAATPEQRAACRDWEAVHGLQRQQEAARAERLREAQRRREAALQALEEQDGWVLLAGEETEVIGRGTRQHVRSLLPLIARCPRGPEGKGCWVILAPDGSEAENGYFDRHCWW